MFPTCHYTDRLPLAYRDQITRGQHNQYQGCWCPGSNNLYIFPSHCLDRRRSIPSSYKTRTTYLILRSEYHECWCPGDARSNMFNPIFKEYVHGQTHPGRCVVAEPEPPSFREAISYTYTHISIHRRTHPPNMYIYIIYTTANIPCSRSTPMCTHLLSFGGLTVFQISDLIDLLYTWHCAMFFHLSIYWQINPERAGTELFRANIINIMVADAMRCKSPGHPHPR